MGEKKNKGGRPGKCDEWLTEEGLLKIEGWARDGLTDEQIAANMGIAPRTLYNWKGRYVQLVQALKRGKEVVDREVENALLKRALGYEYVEKKYVQVEMSDEEYRMQQKMAVNKYRLEHPEASMEELYAVELGVPRYKMILVEEKTKEVSPDVTAQIFWLKNRKPVEWRDKQEIDANINGNINNPMAGLSTEDLKKLINGNA